MTESVYVQYSNAANYGEEFSAVGLITLNRPPMNALNTQLQNELAQAAQLAEKDQSVRAVVVHGGEKVFAAGADVKEMNDLTYTQMSDIAQTLQSQLGVISTISKPTVAAITGYALGGGLEVALGADHRIAGDNAKIGFPEIHLGVIPGGGGTQRLARLVGPAKAKELIFTGRYVKAEEALQLGIIDAVTAPDQVLYESLKWAAQFSRGPKRALAAAKAAIDEGIELSLADGLHVEARLFAGLFATKDRAIGMQSFVDNGPGKAQFSGE